ncbi:hypothetical protein [Alteraurantiacibacter aestuarii]|uniref:Uncharacterized protein n=1 Tax=Alteraurantiacibacter aestuarii TaxID=650004 RepID=A0A844ZNN7_9SPHN|nr:hypothetical protein [Alteraurantiacibacter aestuarii]MXO87259.1 hypothetical protein [Alteraurantiacibacter aestuarii]
MKPFAKMALAALLLAPVPALAQQTEAEVGVPPAAPADWQAPRTPWGDPDLRGTYPLESMGSTPMQRPARFGSRKLLNDEEYAQSLDAARELAGLADVEDEAGVLGSGNWFERGVPLRQTSLIVEPADGRVPPLTPAGEALRAQMRDSWNNEVFEGPQDFNSLDRCLSRGLPATMIPFPYNNGLRVFQAPGVVVINLEMIHETRVIHLGEAAPPPGTLRTYLGHSRGHWEGNTLVVETTHFNGLSPMVIVGPSNRPIPTSEQLQVTEHFTMTGPGQVYYEAWITDPVVLTDGFKMAFPWTRDDEYQPFEYACHEGNTIVPAYVRATSPRFADWRVANGGTREPAPVN